MVLQRLDEREMREKPGRGQKTTQQQYETGERRGGVRREVKAKGDGKDNRSRLSFLSLLLAIGDQESSCQLRSLNHWITGSLDH